MREFILGSFISDNNNNNNNLKEEKYSAMVQLNNIECI